MAVRNPESLANQRFDLVIIGGGIFGAGIARDAAQRGLKTALVEKADFASGTSSRSSKLIHGGFRYLEHMEFGLVAESCRERRILQDIAPHLVRPVPFILPVYDGDPHPLWQMRIGMGLYDLLAQFRNTARHRGLTADEACALEPRLLRKGLRGAILFYDCQEDDARLCLENVLQAADFGASVANYCDVTGLVREGDRIVAAQVIDRLTGAQFDIRARAFVNAAGPWVERVEQLAHANGDLVHLAPTKGAHLIIPRWTRGHGLFFQTRGDRRMIFVIPWGDYTIVGTTDTDFRGDLDDVFADGADVRYIIDQLRLVMGDQAADVGDVITTFAGIRPLLYSGESASARSREHHLARQGGNLLTIAGGKYTTYRAVADEVVQRVYEVLAQSAPPCRTATTPLPQDRPAPAGARLSGSPLVHESDISHGCRHEMATSVSDVMRRRTMLALSRYGGEKTASRVAKIIAPLLGWSDAQREASLAEYIAEWRRSLPGKTSAGDT